LIALGPGVAVLLAHGRASHFAGFARPSSPDSVDLVAAVNEKADRRQNGDQEAEEDQDKHFPYFYRRRVL
jgi:hypothetical protein